MKFLEKIILDDFKTDYNTPISKPSLPTSPPLRLLSRQEVQLRDESSIMWNQFFPVAVDENPLFHHHLRWDSSLDKKLSSRQTFDCVESILSVAVGEETSSQCCSSYTKRKPPLPASPPLGLLSRQKVEFREEPSIM
ncbi:hypothetical protein CEXT_599761 [Caerostris extrusa]|uniref:Uncharacterized protein n=1 Tax=Caerostris extrusa TaxID=172846 RepID=A0AAV4RLL4_CAEEX|nr:hypothetical protein CEXT_599761 [Caerostris extrusa]